MTRTAHDSFAKDLLSEMLDKLGQFQAPLEVRDSARQIDAWFVPAESSVEERSKLGLLGAIVEKECLLEPVHAQLSAIEIRKCMRRQYILFGELERKAAQKKRTLKDDEYPDLWILGTTVSPEVTEELLAKKGWPVGVYFSPGIFKVAIVAINQLPANAETLWLRMLGKGGVQKRAFNEVKELPEESPFSKNVLDVVQKWYSALHGKEEKSPEEQELIMELATSFAEWEQATLQRGIEQGIERGQVQMQRQFIENFLMARFGAIDEALADAIESLLKMSMAEVTSLMLELSSLEKEEFLARLENNPPN